LLPLQGSSALTDSPFLHNADWSSRSVLIMSVKEISQWRKCWKISGFHSSLSQIRYPTKCAHFIFH
jgi:hypothetical protein